MIYNNARPAKTRDFAPQSREWRAFEALLLLNDAAYRAAAAGRAAAVDRLLAHGAQVTVPITAAVTELYRPRSRLRPGTAHGHGHGHGYGHGHDHAAVLGHSDRARRPSRQDQSEIARRSRGDYAEITQISRRDCKEITQRSRGDHAGITGQVPALVSAAGRGAVTRAW